MTNIGESILNIIKVLKEESQAKDKELAALQDQLQDIYELLNGTTEEQLDIGFDHEK